MDERILEQVEDSLRRCNSDPRIPRPVLRAVPEVLAEGPARSSSGTDFVRQKRVLQASLQLLLVVSAGRRQAPAPRTWTRWRTRHGASQMAIGAEFLYDLWLDSLLATGREVDPGWSARGGGGVGERHDRSGSRTCSRYRPPGRCEQGRRPADLLPLESAPRRHLAAGAGPVAWRKGVSMHSALLVSILTAALAPAVGLDRDVAVARARKALAERKLLEPERPEMVSAVEQTWPDASLGCPRKDAPYAQVTTPGWRVVLGSEAARYEECTWDPPASSSASGRRPRPLRLAGRSKPPGGSATSLRPGCADAGPAGEGPRRLLEGQPARCRLGCALPGAAQTSSRGSGPARTRGRDRRDGPRCRSRRRLSPHRTRSPPTRPRHPCRGS